MTTPIGFLHMTASGAYVYDCPRHDGYHVWSIQRDMAENAVTDHWHRSHVDPDQGAGST